MVCGVVIMFTPTMDCAQTKHMRCVCG
jgi:hypothetical protein